MRVLAAGVLVLASGLFQAQPVTPPIIDVHLHALPVETFVPMGGPAPIPHCVPMTDIPSLGYDCGRLRHLVARSRAPATIRPVRLMVAGTCRSVDS